MSYTKLFFFLSFFFVELLPPLCQVQQPAESICTHCWTCFVAVLSVLQKAFAFAFVFWWFVQLCCGCSLGRKKERNAWTRIRLDWQGHWGIFRPHFFSFFCLFLERHASMRQTPLLWNAFCSFSVWGSSCLEELSLGGDKYLVIPPSGCAEMTCLTGSF